MNFSPCVISQLSCFLLATAYVGSLYVWNSNLDRNHPKTVKQRFMSALFMLFLSPFCVYITLSLFKTQDPFNLLEELGLRIDGFITAIILPLILTTILYLGPITPIILDKNWYIGSMSFWKESFQDILWIRNNIVAPISEEFTFRACMLPQLLRCFPAGLAIFIAPLFFGVCHLHHMLATYRKHKKLFQAFIVACFQLLYTTVFGIYAAFLFVRTGHIIAPCIAHAFCNLNGFPDFMEINRRTGFQQCLLIVAYLSGLVAFCLLLWPLTNPSLYNNVNSML